ncbi:bifunctional riboflavin kinase/FAD synthetase [Bartonella sp. HY761]|uniref:bifunctional riboflavin kinase/FAD synthetase n=1 Tax=Bartonella sp. HY761 TaxID=2979330 RepID=UPI0021FB9E03|nr:bifunctional riboflavin kinase/FAD synthetase [Bartonella sp. HY761]UXN07727.1 bifunctional riboflavin kinase/FAD synthetase [Bartonella sp. HY761]
MQPKKIIRLPDVGVLPSQLQGGVIAIGNFDGVHRGHLAVLETALEKARLLGKPAIVLTFEPHPRSFFNPTKPLYRLTPADERAEILEKLGFDAVIEQRFTKDFSSHQAKEFTDTILRDCLKASVVVTGDNFHFGAKRSGTPEFLINEGKNCGFDVVIVDGFLDENRELVSSSRIRQALSCGAVEEAAGLLGYRYTIKSNVVHGAALGRQIGFPTANMRLDSDTGLKFGVYAVRFRTQNGKIFNGVASYGLRPTVNELKEPLLETFIFDFNEDIYGQTCFVSFFSYLRGELKFDGLEPMIEQIKKDEEEAREILTHIAPLNPIDQYLAFDNWDK